MELTNQNGGDIFPLPENVLLTKTSEERTELIRKYLEQFAIAVNKGFQYGKALGLLLIEEKKELGSRGFAPYLKKLGLPRRTAYWYMFIYENKDEIEKHIKEGLPLTKIYKILNGKDPKKQDPKQPKFIEDQEQVKERERQEALKEALRKEKQAWYGRKKRAIKNKAINVNDIPIWEEEGKKKIEQGEKLKEEGMKQLEQLKYLRIIENKKEEK